MIPRFGSQPLTVRQMPGGRFAVLDLDGDGAAIRFHDSTGRLFRVPPGMSTDFASVPRPLRNLVPRWSASARAAVVHDYLYQHGAVTRAQADRVFHDALRASGVGPVGAFLMYLGVRVGGRAAWRKARAREEE